MVKYVHRVTLNARLIAANLKSPLEIETILLDAKMETIVGALRPRTLIYTHYRTGLVEPLRQAVHKAGYSVGLYTGEEKSGLNRFIVGEVDVLIGTSPVGTGVDGLQRVCNRMIIVSLPWTSAEYEQLIGRLHRQGSVFDKIEVITPQVVLRQGDAIWSWDKMRMNRIQYKKTLADAALDGVIPERELASEKIMLQKANEALQAWIKRVEGDGVVMIERALLAVPLPESVKQRALRSWGDFATMNARINSADSHTTHERLCADPAELYLYHTLYREARQS